MNNKNLIIIILKFYNQNYQILHTRKKIKPPHIYDPMFNKIKQA